MLQAFALRRSKTELQNRRTAWQDLRASEETPGTAVLEQSPS